MTRNFLFCGVGGQGTILASKLVARAALAQGASVRAAETIGMAQRGGSVASHLRIGEERTGESGRERGEGRIYSPLVPLGTADAIIGFEPAEAVRSLRYLHEGGTVVVSAKAIAPTTALLSVSGYNGEAMLEYLRAHVAQVVVVDGEAICSQCGSAKVLNTALLGAASACGALGIECEQLEAALTGLVPERFVAMNVCALRAGGRAATATHTATGVLHIADAHNASDAHNAARARDVTSARSVAGPHNIEER